MSLEETRVKQEPLDELNSNEAAVMISTCQVPIKVEIEYDTEESRVKSEPSCENSESENGEIGLYHKHVMKDELLGPERVQSPRTVAPSATWDSNVATSEPPSTSHHTVTYTNETPPPPLSHPHQRYVCDICQKDFARTDLLRIHKRTHTGDKPYSCNTCKREFAQLAHLKGHVMIHTGEKPHRCNECDMGFRQLSSLKRHQRSHAGEKPYSCNVCGKRFTRRAHVTKHKMSRHKGV